MSAALALQLVQYLAAGAEAFDIIVKINDKIAAIRARGRAPTEEELHAIALDARGQFEALPKPEAP